MLIGLLALTVAALFTGAAFYVNFAEQPARLGLKDRPLLAEWKTAYRRGAIMQASLAAIGFILGAIAWWQTGKPAFLAGALLIAGQLAVDADRHQAGQRCADGDRSRQSRAQDPRPHRHLEQAACGADRARRAFGHFLSLCPLRRLIWPRLDGARPAGALMRLVVIWPAGLQPR